MNDEKIRLAVATSSDYSNLHPDDERLFAALERRGVAIDACVWNDAAIDWARYDAVLVRTIWDYFRRYDEYQRWLDRLERAGVRTLNPLDVLRWNADKRYLLELARRGVPIVPTSLAAGGDLLGAIRALDADTVVVKPVVSGGAWHTVCGRRDDPAFHAQLAALPRALDYLVQPFLREIVAGEWSLLFFDGVFSHAVLKTPAAGDYRVQTDFGGSTRSSAPPPSVVAAAQAALEATRALGDGALRYARVDGVCVDGTFLVMELELIEPLLFLRERPDAAERFAAVVARAAASDRIPGVASTA